MLKTLEKLGLTDKEAKVYLANLELGPAKIQDVAKKSKIKRTTVYVIIDSLMQKGLISFYQSKKTKKFVAEEPYKLSLLLKEKQDVLKKIMPQLEALVKKDKTERPEVRFYQGREGCLTILEETLEKASSEIFYLGSIDDIYKIITKDYDYAHYIPTRIAKKIKFKALLFQDEGSLKLKANEKKHLREIKFLPKTYFFSSSMFIFQDKIALISSEKELVGIVIKSQDLAEMECQKFRLLWDKL